MEKRFNVKRPFDETIDQFLNRVKTNLEKALSKKRKKTQPPPPTVEVKLTSLDGNDVPVDDTQSVGDILLKAQVLLNVNGDSFGIAVNPPIVESMKLPDSIMAGFIAYPNDLRFDPQRLNFMVALMKLSLHFSISFGDKDASEFSWYVSEKMGQEINDKSLGKSNLHQ